MGKPRGILTARKQRDNRRVCCFSAFVEAIRLQENRWHDNDFKKANLGTRWKANPFGGASHAKGIVVEKVGCRIMNTERTPNQSNHSNV